MSQPQTLQLPCGKDGNVSKFALGVFFGSGFVRPVGIPDPADFFLRPILEPNMATFTRSQSLLVSVGAAALGGAALATLLAGNVLSSRMRAQPPWTIAAARGPDIPICRTPAATGSPNMMFRLAQTEVPRAEMSAASAAPAFAETEPPLWTGLGSIT